MYRKGVSALIINTSDEFLLVNLESFQEKYFAIPGGGVESQETLDEAVHREIFEELGIVKDSLALIGNSEDPVRFLFKHGLLVREGKNYIGQERYFFGFRFIGSDVEIKPKTGEVRSYKWVSLISLKSYLLFDNQFQETVKKIAEIFPTILNEVSELYLDT